MELPASKLRLLIKIHCQRIISLTIIPIKERQHLKKGLLISSPDITAAKHRRTSCFDFHINRGRDDTAAVINTGETVKCIKR